MSLKDNEIIKGCRNFNEEAQHALYDKYSSVLRGICIRYASSKADAEDILQEGFIKIYTKIRQYSGIGSFEGWLKRVMINTAITHCSKEYKKRYHKDISEMYSMEIASVDEEDTNEELSIRSIVENAEFSRQDLIDAVQMLPENYRLVFNLFAIEGFKHKEIAKELHININTSKSQVMRARKLLQQKLYDLAVAKKSIKE